MKARTIAWALVALLCAASSHAQDEKSFPAPIQEDLARARKECADADDGKVGVRPDFVRKLDLTSDGRPDYIVNFDELTCSTFESVFCGTGGCERIIYVTTRGGELRQVFSGMVRSYKISKAPGAKTITFHLHGGFCGEGGYYDCVKKRRITEKPFEFKDR
jgi:hypothetical protein